MPVNYLLSNFQRTVQVFIQIQHRIRYSKASFKRVFIIPMQLCTFEAAKLCVSCTCKCLKNLHFNNHNEILVQCILIICTIIMRFREISLIMVSFQATVCNQLLSGKILKTALLHYILNDKLKIKPNLIWPKKKPVAYAESNFRKKKYS